ncbi:hypothetical protein J3R73_004641 [Labrys monachus]|uniref:Uncharacterized protein n=1 Tax=Labrys monachus TaxID=217067 RepID=A0ABU0FJR0_9HYPH|nr:hypothetical protein [Labrys monachus]
MASHVVQGRRRPFPAGPGRANRQRAGARLFPIDPDQACDLNRIAGWEASPAPEGTVPSITSHAGQATHPDTASRPGKPVGTQASPTERAGQGPWRTAYVFAAPRRPGSRVPVLPRPRTLRAGFAGRRRPTRRSGLDMPAVPSSRTVRPAAGASPVSRGIEGRPEGGPIPASSSSSPVCRPDGRVIAHPALPDVGGPGIAPEEDAMGRSATIPLGAGPVLVSKPGRNWTGASMRLARRRRTGIGRSGWKARGGIANLGPAALRF